MSELQAYYEAFKTGYWADSDPAVCPCHGSGWAGSEVDTWHECPVHYKGQLHPDWGSSDATEDDYWLADLDSRTDWAVKKGLASKVPVEKPAPAGDPDCLCVKCEKAHTDCTCDAGNDDDIPF